MNRVGPLILLATLFSYPCHGSTQQEVDRLLEGRLLLSGEPADSGTVILHRFTPEESDDIATARADDEGRFALELPNLPVPGSGEVFFSSWRYEGVLYYGSMITDPGQLDSIYTIEAFPTEAAPSTGISFPLAVRNVFVEEGPMGWRVTDYIVVRNPGSVTYVPDGEDGAVWRYPLPQEALNPRLGGGDVAPADVSSTPDGAIVASNPLPPGERLYVLHYELESLDFDLPLPGTTEVMELLVREPAPAMRVEGLARQASEEIEGASALRWAGRDVEGRTVQVRLGEETETNFVVWFSVAIALLLVGAGAWGIRRSPAGSGPTRTGGEAVSGTGGRLRKDVLVQLAVLEEEYEKVETPSDAESERYRRRRAQLLAELEQTGGAGPGR